MTQHYMGEQKAYFGAAAEHPENRHRYVTLTSSGIKEEGAALRRLYDDPVEALRAYADELEKFTDAHPTIVWRVLPVLEGDSLGFWVRSRLHVHGEVL